VSGSGENWKNHSSEDLENAIMRYQEAVDSEDSGKVEVAYQRVVSMYDPMVWIDTWFRRYRFLYDSAEDFTQDYLRIFITSLRSWKPRHLRKASRYGGKGEFKNYFWGCLSHHMTNLLKSSSAGKRSLAQRCPICEEWCASLSTHVFEVHQELLFDKLASIGYKVENMSECPFCRSHKVPKDTDEAGMRLALRKHMASKHSSLLFERFHELYPTHITLSSKPVSATLYDEATGEEGYVYESMSSSPTLDSLYSYGLSGLQAAIVERILDGESDFELIKCALREETDGVGAHMTDEEFDEAMNGLQDAMHIVGLDS
jgi:hypothetical protein